MISQDHRWWWCLVWLLFLFKCIVKCMIPEHTRMSHWLSSTYLNQKICPTTTVCREQEFQFWIRGTHQGIVSPRQNIKSVATCVAAYSMLLNQQHCQHHSTQLQVSNSVRGCARLKAKQKAGKLFSYINIILMLMYWRTFECQLSLEQAVPMPKKLCRNPGQGVLIHNKSSW